VHYQRDATQLIDRELDVLGLIVERHSNQAIRTKLSSAPDRRSHCSHIFSKLGLRDALEYHGRVFAMLAFLRVT
jgi:ATP/maltotriose-dependent transcriptional regulator MalT